MHRSRSKLSLAVSVFIAGSMGSIAHATDARSVALGGSILANGEGAPGIYANPASMMSMQRRGERVHVSSGAGVDFRDNAGLYEIADDEANDDLEDEIDAAIEELDLGMLECDPSATGAADDVCFRGLEALSDLSGRALNILNSVDGEELTFQATGHAGLAFTGYTYPFAFHFATRATGRGKLSATEEDRDYFESFENILGASSGDRGELTRAEIENTAALGFNVEDGTLDVAEPEDVLASAVEVGAMVRAIFGFSMATTIDVGGYAVDLGVTPKFSTLLAAGVDSNLSDEFEDNNDDDRFEDSEVEDTSFTMDVGGSMRLDSMPIRISGVVRNLVPESVKSGEGVVFETTPQMIVGGLFQRGPLAFNADLAINPAKVDNFDTQLLALGSEFTVGPLALRAGINHDFERTNTATALSLGLGLGPLDIGARATSLEHMQAGLQLSFSF